MAQWRATFKEGNLTQYVRSFEQFTAAFTYSDLNKTTTFRSTLRGRAEALALNIPVATPWGEFRRQLLEGWEPEPRRQSKRDDFPFLKRERKEDAEHYMERLQALAEQVFDDVTPTSRQRTVIAQFVNGQPDPIADKLCALTFNSYSEALTAVLKVESRQQRTARDRHRGTRRADISASGYAEDDPVNEELSCAMGQVTQGETLTPEQIAAYYDPADSDTTGLQGCDEHSVPTSSREWVAEAFQCVLSDENGLCEETAIFSVLRTTAPMKGDRPPQPGRPMVCFFCKKPGHRWMRCFRLKDVLVRNGMKPLAFRPNGPGTDRRTAQVLSVPNQTGNQTKPAPPTPPTPSSNQ